VCTAQPELSNVLPLLLDGSASCAPPPCDPPGDDRCAAGGEATRSTAGARAGAGAGACRTAAASREAREISRVSVSGAETFGPGALALLALATLSGFGIAGTAIGGTLLRRIALAALRDAACKPEDSSACGPRAVARPIAKKAAKTTSIATISAANQGSMRAVALRARTARV
jgi:hypothetical protein